MTSHTPGPWNITKEANFHCLAGPGSPNPSLTAIDAIDPADGKLFEVCAVWGINGPDEDSPTARANAALISAAPELLEALRVALVHVDARQSECDPRLWVGMLKDIDLIRATIAKAEGR